MPTASKGSRNHRTIKKRITNNNTPTRKEETTQTKERKRDNEWKLGTWNIRGLNGKEIELNNEFEKYNLDILGITETKRKGIGEEIYGNGNILLYSGVAKENRAAAGVGCMIKKSKLNDILKWQGYTERILAIELKDARNEILTCIIAYGPNENEKADSKDQFWEELTLITEQCRGTIYIVGDFNARVGSRDKNYETELGKYGENTRSNNGCKLLDYCKLNNLLVLNSFYEHKEIHKLTRLEPSRKEKSIIDYIITEKDNRINIKDVKVKRGAEIGSDHRLLIARIKKKTETAKQKQINNTPKNKQEITKNYKLNEEKVAKKYRNTVEIELNKRTKEIEEEDLETIWKTFKDTIIDTAKKVCGYYNTNNNKKHTAWWTKEIKEQVKNKKQKWQEYINDNTAQKYEIYKRERKKVKGLVLEAKQKTWEQFGEKLEKNAKSNQKLFYRVLKTLRKGKREQNSKVKDKGGKILTDEKEIMSRWKEYFQGLLNIEKDEDDKTETLDTETTNDDENDEITTEEMNDAIKKLKNGKKPGHDRITTEMIKHLGEQGRRVLLEIMNKTWKNKNIPKDWEIGIIVPIHKKGDTKDCNNYRGLTLLSTVLKIYERILENRLQKQIDHTISDAQSGFRKGRSTQDHTFTIQEIINKITQTGRTACCAYIDLEKAFDRASRQKIWTSLERRGTNKNLINAIKNLYKENSSYVIHRNRKTDTFKTNIGLRQGGVLSPILFNVLMDDIIRNCQERVKKLCIGYRTLKKVEISECAFADDVMILAENEKELQKNILIWNEELNKAGMKLNENKTKVQTIGKEKRKLQIKIDKTDLEQVDTYPYLGITIEESGNQEIEINKRIGNALKMFYAMNKTFIQKKEVSEHTKTTVFKSIYIPILTYGCETWILTQKMKSKIQATEMKFLRRIKKVTKLDKISNTIIREELKVRPILEYIERRQLSWWGHLQRMKNTVQVKKVWEAKIQKTKKRGRPKTTWEGSIGQILNKRKKSWSEAKLLAKNKKQWRKFIYEL